MASRAQISSPQPKAKFPARPGDDRQSRAFVRHPMVDVCKDRCFLELVNVCTLFARVAKGTWPPLSLSPSQIVNGYFVHFFAPQGLPVVPKSVVFVIDVSGSMYGRKMEQVFAPTPARLGGQTDSWLAAGRSLPASCLLLSLLPRPRMPSSRSWKM